MNSDQNNYACLGLEGHETTDVVLEKYLSLAEIYSPELGDKPDKEKFMMIKNAYNTIKLSNLPDLPCTNNAYKLFSLDTNASLDDVHKAYRFLSRMYHPDLHPAANPTEKIKLNAQFSLINKFKSILLKELSSEKNKSFESSSYKKSNSYTQSNKSTFFNTDDLISNNINYLKYMLKTHQTSPNPIISAIVGNKSFNEVRQAINENQNLLNQLDQFGSTLIDVACLSGRADIIKLLAPKIDVNHTNNAGLNAMAISIMTNKVDCLNELIDQGADLTEKIHLSFRP